MILSFTSSCCICLLGTPCMNNTAARAHSFRSGISCGGCPWTISFQLPAPAHSKRPGRAISPKCLPPDFDVNGPSLTRIIRVMLNGWQRYKRHRIHVSGNVLPGRCSLLRSSYAGAVWATRKWYRKMSGLPENERSFAGYLCHLWVENKNDRPLIGRYAYWMLRKEEERLGRAGS